MIRLVPGANTAIVGGRIKVRVACHPLAGIDIDVSAFALASSGKVRSDSDMCFYAQPEVLAGALQLNQPARGEHVFLIDLERLDAGVEKIALTATIHDNKARFGAVTGLQISMPGVFEADIDTLGMEETALVLGEFYRRQGTWKFRCVAQGFAGGLAPLASHFGIQIDAASAAPAPAAPAAAPPSPPVSLHKITLDKRHASISLDKSAAGFGEIKVNLNWNKAAAKPGGFFSRSKSIDLDVGCLFELQDGSKGAVQALGDAFGKLDARPFIQLQGDDRSGAANDGEWLIINGQKWSEFSRILIYAFIYDGAPDWQQTDGVVTIFVPGQAEIVVRLNEEGGRQGMCAIAMLENQAGAVKVTRLVDFHASHAPMDTAYGWGMRWSAGSK